MTWLIPIISAILYRLGGSEYGNKWFRWLMGISIAIITHNWWYILTYYLATAVFVYGDNSWVSKLTNRKVARLIHGLAFGLASFHWFFAIWVMVAFYIFFELAERDFIDNKWSELLRGFTGTLIFVF